MSARVWYVLECDADGCGATFTAELPKAFATRDAAARSGWTHVVPDRVRRVGPVKSHDLCPAHKERPS